jgi:hypothetical protein
MIQLLANGWFSLPDAVGRQEEIEAVGSRSRVHAHRSCRSTPVGACQFLVGLGVFVKNQFSRWTGVVVLAANTIAQLLIMPAYPFWSLTLIAMDILAIYGLIAYGKRIA